MLRCQRNNEIAVQDGREIGRNKQTTVRPAREPSDNTFDVRGGFYGPGYKLDAESWSNNLSRLSVVSVGAGLGIEEDRDPRNTRCGLFKHGKPFTYDGWFIKEGTGEIPTRSREALYKPCTYRISDADEYDWNFPCFAFQRACYNLRRREITSGFKPTSSFACL